MEKRDSSEEAEVVQVSEARTKEDDEAKGGFQAYWRIFTFADKIDWVLFAVGFVVAIASGTTLALVNIVFGGFVTAVTNFAQGTATKDDFLGTVNQYALYYVYLAIARFAFTYTYTVCTNVASTRIARNIRQKYLEATLSQEIGFFDQGQGSVSIAISTNGNLIQNGTSEKLGLSVQAISSFVSAFVVAFITQWKLTLITLCIAPGIVIVIGVVVSIDAVWETKILEIYAKAGAFAEDVFASMRTVHAFWARPLLVEKYCGYLEEALRIGKKKSPLYGIMFSTEFFMVYAGFALAFWQGTHMYARGEIKDAGAVATVLFSVVVAATSLTQLAPNALPITNAASAASALFKVIDRKSKINPFDQGGQQPERSNGEMEFLGVGFAYPTRADVPVLEDFSLRIPANKVTALVGASGSGKSTVVGLCERWYDPTSGTIKLDGIPVHELNTRWLRTRIRMVQQEPVLFTGTVFENVRNGLVGTKCEHASETEQFKLVESACKLAYAHDFISELPDGYYTQIGEKASMLSGGQKQRIAIARSIVSEPAILLLDEATSALDPQAEGIVQAALDKASQNRTTIVIAHKLATIKNADNIVVMSKGRIIEQGTHESLLEANGTYARLVRIQDLGRAAETSLERFEDINPKEVDIRTTLTRYATEDRNRMELQKDRDNYDVYRHFGLAKTIWMLIREQRKMRLNYILMVVTCAFGGAVYPALAILFSEIQNVFLLTGPELTNRGNFFSLMFFIVAIANAIVYFIVGYDANLIVQHMTKRYRREMFDSILKQDLQFFDRPENTSGALTSKLSTQPTAIQELMGFQVGLIVIIFFNLISSCSLAIAYGWKLGIVIVFAGLPPLVGSGLVRYKLDQKMEKISSNRYAESASLAGEAVGAIRTVSSLALEPQIMERYKRALRHVVRQITISTLKTMAWFAITQSIEFLFLALGFWYGCRLVANGEYTLKQFYVVFLSVFFSGQASAQFFSYSVSITNAKSAANYVFWIRALQPTISDTTDNEGRSPPKDAQSLTLDNTRFSYPLRPDAQVLRGVSLDIEPGQFIALVGASGCGKTTIVALLERFYDPVSGRIMIDANTNIADLSPRLYRQHLSLVQQEPALYAGTIMENINLGKKNNQEVVEKDQAEELVNAALRQANAYDFVSSLPEGVDTQVGRSGIQLSGGQRQRIAIARALIRNPDILLLDEATSALDTESEKVVQVALAEAAQGQRITVAVAHRLSTIKDADKICVFMGGKIIEAGKHQDLLNEGGVYAQMCKAQSLDRTV